MGQEHSKKLRYFLLQQNYAKPFYKDSNHLFQKRVPYYRQYPAGFGKRYFLVFFFFLNTMLQIICTIIVCILRIWDVIVPLNMKEPTDAFVQLQCTYCLGMWDNSIVSFLYDAIKFSFLCTVQVTTACQSSLETLGITRMSIFTPFLPIYNKDKVSLLVYK